MSIIKIQLYKNIHTICCNAGACKFSFTVLCKNIPRGHDRSTDEGQMKLIIIKHIDMAARYILIKYKIEKQINYNNLISVDKDQLLMLLYRLYPINIARII